MDGEAENDEAELEVGIEDKECGAEAGSGSATVYERMGRRNKKALISATVLRNREEKEGGWELLEVLG